MSTVSLRTEVLRGGSYLAMRQAVGTVINVAGVLLLTRSLGPSAYGVYAAAIGLFTAVQLFAQLGVGVYLVRAVGDDREDLFRCASTLLLVSGVLAAGASILAMPLIERWTRVEGVGLIGLVVFALLPVSNLTQVPLARLERALDYRRVAWVELAGQLLFFVVAIPLARMNAGPWAPTAGFGAQQLAAFFLTHAAASYWPRVRWAGDTVRGILAYGAGFTTSIWLYQLRRVVNPLVVGRYLGAEAVGVIAIATQIVTHLSFVAQATWRLSMAALARVQNEPSRLRRAVSDGMRLQTLLVAPFLVVFGWLAPLVVPALLGEDWSRVSLVFPFLALAGLANAMFNLQSSVLYVLRLNAQMAWFHAAQTGLLLLAALILVPRMGLPGYGVAELVAMASYLVLHVFSVRAMGAPSYGQTFALAGAATLGLAYPLIGVWSLIGFLLVGVAARPWREVEGLLTQLRTVAHG